MQIAHLSDTHLGYMQYNLENREQDFYDVFNEVIDKILEEHVKIVIHSGDFFHTPRPPIKALKVAQDGLLKLKEKGIDVIVIPGGHDTLRRRGLPPLSLYERFGVKVLQGDNFYVKINDICIVGMRHYPKLYWSNPELQKMLQNFSLFVERSECRKKILMMHQGLYPYMVHGYELALEKLPRNFNYYAMGHLHKRIIVPYGEGILAYPGSTEIVEMSEIEEYEKNGKGFYLVDLSGDIPEIEKINLDHIRPQFVVDWKNGVFEDLVKEINNIVHDDFSKKPILHIKVYNKVVDRPTFERMIGRMFEKIFLKMRIITYTEEEKSIKRDVLNKERISIEEILTEYLKDHDLVSFIILMLDNLKNNDVKAAIYISEKVFTEKSWKRWVDALKKAKA